MVKEKMTNAPIRATKKFRIGECIKDTRNSNCYIVYKLYNNGKNIDLLNIHDGSFNLKVPMKEIVANYIMIAINPITYLTLLNGYPTSELNAIAEDYALQVCINVIERKDNQEKDIEDYPTVVVAAKPKYDALKSKQSDYVVVSKNLNWTLSNWHQKFVDRLGEKKYALGAKCPDKKIQCKNTIGNCAEQHAANNLIILNPNIELTDIVYSCAIRPRTGEVIPYCENCVAKY